MEMLILFAMAIIFVVAIVIFVQFKNLSTKQQSSSEQAVQLFTIFKSDVESAVKSVADATRSNNETMASTLQLVSSSFRRAWTTTEQEQMRRSSSLQIRCPSSQA